MKDACNSHESNRIEALDPIWERAASRGGGGHRAASRPLAGFVLTSILNHRRLEDAIVASRR